MRETNACLLLLPPGNASTGPAHDNVEIHTKDTDSGVVTCSQVDVLLDTEAKVSGHREVATTELVFLDLQATLENLLGFGAADGDVYGDLFVATDTKSTDGVSGLGGHGRLTGELFQNLRGSCQTITRLADGDVDDEFVDPEVPHWVGGGGLGIGLVNGFI